MTTGARLIVVWGEPRDAAAFEKDYLGRHLPLVRQLANLRSLTVSTVSSRGQFRFVELGFDTLEDLRDAFTSPGGREVALDAKQLAAEHDSHHQSFELSQVLLAEPARGRNE